MVSLGTATRSRIRSANSSGVREPVVRAPAAPAEQLLGPTRGLEEHVDDRVGERFRILGVHEQPVLAVADEIDRMPPARAAITGLPRQNASSTILGRPSERDGSTSADDESNSLSNSLCSSDGYQRVWRGSSTSSSSTIGTFGPRPTRRSSASGTRGAASRQASASTSTPL